MSPSEAHPELRKEASALVGDGGPAILTTCASDGMPHATWMTAIVTAQLSEVISITSPASRKAANLQANQNAEWMFSSPSFETVIYLSGPTEIIADQDEAQEYWHRVPGKSKGYYRHYCNPEDHRDFAIIRTLVKQIHHARPIGYRSTSITPDGAKVPPPELNRGCPSRPAPGSRPDSSPLITRSSGRSPIPSETIPEAL